jgi:hypothetical protein
MIGKRMIPQEELKGVNEYNLKIFLTESDPDKWPSEIFHLRKYVYEKKNA